jgi:tellurite methyltransferase
MTKSPWAREYVRTPRDYIWGIEPSLFARELVALLPARARVLDLGCGEGRDSVFFARGGFAVTGAEVSLAGLRKAERLARAQGVKVRWIHANIARLAVPGPFGLVYSCGAIHYVPRGRRARVLARLKRLTCPGGYHGFVVFTDRIVHPDKGEVIDYFAPGELARAYEDWLVLRCEEDDITCAREGVPHRHSVERFLARRPRA